MRKFQPNLINMKNLSYLKALRAPNYATYTQEFLQGMPRGVYENKRANLTALIGKVTQYVNACRKNHTREEFNEKCKVLRSLLSSLRILLYREYQLNNNGAAIEFHSYVIRVMDMDSNLQIVPAARAMLFAWAGTQFPSVDALKDQISEVLDECDNLIQFMEQEDLLIANIPTMAELRKPLDDLIFSIIKKAEVEQYELSPDIESEVERLELINEFLNFVKNWITRIKISVKNYNNGGEIVPPQPELPQTGTDITEEDGGVPV